MLRVLHTLRQYHPQEFTNAQSQSSSKSPVQKFERCAMKMSLLKPFLLCWVAITILSRGSFAQTVRVPQDYSTVQAAVNAVPNGGTVLVSPGIYAGTGNYDIQFGKNITLQGVSGPNSTIIECGGLGRGFLINQGESQALHIDGFTIRNGAALTAPVGSGAAVFVSISSAVTLRIVSWKGPLRSPYNSVIKRMPGPYPVLRDTIFRKNTAGCILSWKQPTRC